MENMLTYVKETMQTFGELPFGEVDSLILSWLSYLRLEDIDEKEVFPIRNLYKAELFEILTEGVKSQKETIKLLCAVTASPRFRDMKIAGFTHENSPGFEDSKQFAAMGFILDDETMYIAFRGTDCTLVGWKEDFNLALQESVPSQKLALVFLEDMAIRYQGVRRFLVGGHSKGGNMAVYAAAHAEHSLQEKICAVYTHDGPGFLKEDLEFSGFAAIRDRVHKTLPKSSLFGLIFEQEAEYTIVESDSVSVGQHNPMNWHVEGNQFVRSAGLTPDAKVLYHRINAWIAKLNQEERKRFIDGIFSILEETGARSFDEFGAHLRQNIPIVVKSVADMDHETRDFLIRVLLEI